MSVSSILTDISHDRIATLLADVSVKSVVVLLGAALLSIALRRASAASRHALWLASLAALASLPFLSLAAPKLVLPILPATAPRPLAAPKAVPIPDRYAGRPQRDYSGEKQATFSSPTNAAALQATVIAQTVSSAAQSAEANAGRTATQTIPAARISAAVAIGTIWLAGTCLMLARMMLGFVCARRLVRSCRPVQPSNLPRLSQTIVMLEGRDEKSPSVPMTCGVRRPAILLPLAAREWPADRLQAAILHETAHIQRRDWLTMVFAQAVCAIYWWNPLAWIAAQRMHLESEQACDDRVLSAGIDAADYASHLLEVARGLQPAARAAALAMAQPHEIVQRLESILSERRDRRGVTAGAAAVAGVLVLASGSLAAMQLATRHSPRANPAAVAGASDLSETSSVTLKLVQTLHTDADINCIAFTPDSRRILAGSWSQLWDDFQVKYSHDGTLAFWSAETGKRLSERELPAPLLSVAYSPDGKLLATGYAGGVLRISDSATGRTLRQTHLPSDGIELLQFSPDGLTLACGTFQSGECTSGPGPLYLVDPSSGKQRGAGYHGVFRKIPRNWNRQGFAVAAQTGRLATWNDQIELWSPAWKQPTITLPLSSVSTCAVHGNLVAALRSDTIYLWDTRTQRRVGDISIGDLNNDGYAHLAFSPDGRYLAYGGAGAIKVWRVMGT